MRSSHLCESRTPNTCSYDNLFCTDGLVAEHHALHASILFQHSGNFAELDYVSAVADCIENIGIDQTEGVDGSVGNLHCADEGGVHCGFESQRLLGSNCLRVYATVQACLDELGLILQAVFGKRDEQTSGGVDAGRSDPAQDAVLADAFGRTLGVGHGIPRAAVQQAVVAARSTVAEVASFDEQGLQPAQSAVPRGSGSRYAAADDDHIVFFI